MEMDEFTYYPPKPEINERNTASLIKTIGSLVVFVALFMFLNISINLIFLVVLVLFLHEMGHLIAMKSYNYDDVGMLFIPFLGAVVTGRKEEMSQFQRIIIVLAGPLPGIIIGFGILALYYFALPNIMLLKFAMIFIALNVLNLIPLDPLDGGKLFELLFFTFNEFSKIIFTVLSASAMIAIGYYADSLVIMLFGGFTLFRVQSHYKLIKLRKRLAHLEIPLTVSYSNLTDKDYWRLRKEYIHIANLGDMISPESKDYDESEQVLAPAIRNLLRTPVTKDVSIFGKIIFVAIWIGATVGSVYTLWYHLNIFGSSL